MDKMELGMRAEAINLNLSPGEYMLTHLRSNRHSSEPYSTFVGSSINAMSNSSSFNRIMIGGREILKIVTADTFQETHNLRIGKAKSLCTHDVKWNPSDLYKDVVATASTNGHILLWNAETGKKSFEMCMSISLLGSFHIFNREYSKIAH